MKENDLHMSDRWCEQHTPRHTAQRVRFPASSFVLAQMRDWFKFAAIVSNHVQEEVCNRLEDATVQQRKNEKELLGTETERS